MKEHYQKFIDKNGIEVRVYQNHNSIEFVPIVGDGTEKDRDFEITFEEIYETFKEIFLK